MRRSFAFVPALALIAAPVVAQAQTQPTNPPRTGTNPPPAGQQPAQPTGGQPPQQPTNPTPPAGGETGGTAGGETGAQSGGATGGSNGGAGTPGSGTSAVESQPALPAATEDTPPAAGSSATRGATSATPAGSGINTQPTPDNLESRTTPIVEIHGYLRTRGELFQNFAMGWDQVPTGMATGQTMPSSNDTYNTSLLPWYRNPDNNSNWCVPDPGTGPLMPGSGTGPFASSGRCNNGTQISGNMRFRVNPEIHPTEFITIHSQIDILDNLVLGSTPEGQYVPGSLTSPWAPLNSMSMTQVAPVYGLNSLTQSILVKRAWAEISNQTLGQLRIGRMPAHWGMGMIWNAGNGFDSDYQSTADRIMYSARLRPLGLFASAMYEFVSSGATGFNNFNEVGQGQPVSLGLFDDVHQGAIALGRRLEPEQARAAIARNEFVVNGGLFVAFRGQFLSNDRLTSAMAGTMPSAYVLPDGRVVPNYSGGNGTNGMDPRNMDLGYGGQLIRRDAWTLIPDLWFQLLGPNFRLELEASYIHGELRNVFNAGMNSGCQTMCNQPHIISQFGGVLDAEYRLLNQRLRLRFMTGYASGDPDIEGLYYQNGLARQANNDNFITMFEFHRDFRIDLIYWRQIQRRVAGAYFFRPSVAYNFIDEPNGDLFFGNVDVIWSRASDFVQTRGNHADIGLEIDATLQYQSNHRRPDSLDPRPAPGFYALAQYGIFLPFGALGPTDVETRPGGQYAGFSLGTAQTVRVILGVQY